MDLVREIWCWTRWRLAIYIAAAILGFALIPIITVLVAIAVGCR